MPFKWVILWTDALIYLLVISVVIFVWQARKKLHWRQAWAHIMQNKMAVVALCVLTVYVTIGLLDSIHYRVALPVKSNTASQVQGQAEVHYSPHTQSLLDRLMRPLDTEHERTYSAPFALNSYVKETITNADGSQSRIYPHLKFINQQVHTEHQQLIDIGGRVLSALVLAAVLMIALKIVAAWRRKLTKHQLEVTNAQRASRRVLFYASGILLFLIILSALLMHAYHILGTGKVGQDIFYQSIKSIRTGLVIGTLTTLVMLPFAILLGIAAGFFGGWLDDAIQYLYTTLSSIPGVLLIAAAILSLQVFISNHSEWFSNLAQRADARLLALCLILGVTSWTGLCRLLRAETLKVREIDYIQAARTLGTSRWKMIVRHILPNVMHIVLIAVVLDFSGLVLAEAVLSYVGVGVAPTTNSWGNMINSARLQLAREPIVWWPILAAFVFMFILVLAANLFADSVRDAFDPRLQHSRK